MVEGKNEAMSTSELSGGARINYIFQSIFVKSLEVWTFFLLYMIVLKYYISVHNHEMSKKCEFFFCL
jgi:hypothetical protein